MQNQLARQNSPTRPTAPVLTALLACAFGLTVPIESFGQSVPEVSTAEFNQWMEEISNWGRWGEDDELGTLNLITDGKRRAASNRRHESGRNRFLA